MILDIGPETPPSSLKVVSYPGSRCSPWPLQTTEMRTDAGQIHPARGGA
jgi:hypothetical protein